MNKKELLSKISDLYYKKNINLLDYLKSISETGNDRSVEDILISYDFQAGSYVKEYESNPEWKDKFLKRLTATIDSFDCRKESILECGVGEATTLVPLLNQLNSSFEKKYGIDISWSRCKAGLNFSKLGGQSISLAVADMFSLPFQDNSIDIVYTCHSLEPNGGHEKELLGELYRVTSRYLILIEPCYEYADTEARERMSRLGYITHLLQSARELNLDIISYDLYGVNSNELNPSGIMVIRKNAEPAKNGFACPITKTPLLERNGAYFSEEALLAYPILDGVPMLTEDNAIVATKFLGF